MMMMMRGSLFYAFCMVDARKAAAGVTSARLSEGARQQVMKWAWTRDDYTRR